MINNIEGLIERVSTELKEFTDIAVLGMSGGADSTLVAILCSLALGNENVYGYSLPYDQYSSNNFSDPSSYVAKMLGIKYSTISIKDSVSELAYSAQRVSNIPLSRLNLGNIKSRVRMILLYTMNAKINENLGYESRVIGTGNLSEDYIGYDTKGGDALADIFPIGSLFKSEVYQLLDYFAAKGVIEGIMINRIPSAGLEPEQTDEGDLGYTYDEMEIEIRKIISKATDPFDMSLLDSEYNETMEFVKLRHENHKHKHEAPRVIDLSEFNGMKFR